MKSETLIALGILFFVVCGCLSHTLLESFRGRGGGGRRGEAEEEVVEAEEGRGGGYLRGGGWYRRGMLGLVGLLIGLYHVIGGRGFSRRIFA